MSAAVIKVKFADPAKGGKKQATIKTDDGQIFGVWPDKFGLLQPGRSYKIEFSERDYQGKTYRTITRCDPIDDARPELPKGAPNNDAEAEFVTRILAAGISICAVGWKPDDLTTAARMIRKVYRDSLT